MRRAAGLLAGFAVLGAVLVALTWESTAERIAANEQDFLLRSLADVLPADGYDNAVHEDAITVTDPELLGTPEPVTVYRARRDGKPVAAVLTPTAPAGYSGPIRLLVGIRADGTLGGVRVVSHRETPGLGDKIEVERNDWIRGFKGRSLQDPRPGRWAVQRDGGVFDQFTGATITPRAVVSAVRDALIYFDRNRDALFAAPAGAAGLPSPAAGDEEEE
ncbi:electron transport complex subunit RsxG [Thioalkalivibrio sp. XN8]|uniref:electron transport complex subunit RsxG n=1 Tax=Thioalkalivibrio sp. XN8 TaxID=2712863 RepID=UPI0013EA08A8|nr:electron transport complex subunit RsxG [Thioalkalivibrio sp. XN8]NGP51889.1 electron transport complex subunit RsxG [Thioalkalivibrio sp. XN8]